MVQCVTRGIFPFFFWTTTLINVYTIVGQCVAIGAFCFGVLLYNTHELWELSRYLIYLIAVLLYINNGCVNTCDPVSIPSEAKLFFKKCSESSVSLLVLASVSPSHLKKFGMVYSLLLPDSRAAVAI